jgi:hypothetical protein
MHHDTERGILREEGYAVDPSVAVLAHNPSNPWCQKLKRIYLQYGENKLEAPRLRKHLEERDRVKRAEKQQSLEATAAAKAAALEEERATLTLPPVIEDEPAGVSGSDSAGEEDTDPSPLDDPATAKQKKAAAALLTSKSDSSPAPSGSMTAKRDAGERLLRCMQTAAGVSFVTLNTKREKMVSNGKTLLDDLNALKKDNHQLTQSVSRLRLEVADAPKSRPGSRAR